MAEVNNSRSKHLWFLWASISQGRLLVRAPGSQRAQKRIWWVREGIFFAKTELPTFQDGFQVKTDVVKGIQISSIFQARGQDAAYFWTHPSEIFHKSPSNEICQIPDTRPFPEQQHILQCLHMFSRYHFNPWQFRQVSTKAAFPQDA